MWLGEYFRKRTTLRHTTILARTLVRMHAYRDDTTIRCRCRRRRRCLPCRFIADAEAHLMRETIINSERVRVRCGAVRCGASARARALERM